MIPDKIKLLREQQGMTQAELAKRLGITRSGVNAWEMGISVPSTQYIVELAILFGVSADYLLELPHKATISVEGLSEREVAVIAELIRCMKEKNDRSIEK